MFEALGYRMDGDHLDFSFRDTSNWPKVSEDDGMPPSLFISVGREVSGPDVQLVVMSPPPADMFLDTHYHGCDQFRAVIQGDFQVQRKRMQASIFGYQVSGIPYREGVLGDTTEDLWMVMVHGERRGARSTMLRNDGDFVIGDFGEDQLDRPVASPDDPYWDAVPGGSKGIIGYGSTLGRAVGGFSWGSFAEDKGWEQLAPGVSVTAGVMSDRQTGPIVLTLRAEAGTIALPRSTYDTEVVLTVIRGTCRIGDKDYIGGEVRVQKTGVALDAVIAGSEGLDAVFVIADRSAMPTVEGHGEVAANWPKMIDHMTAELTPTAA